MPVRSVNSMVGLPAHPDTITPALFGDRVKMKGQSGYGRCEIEPTETDGMLRLRSTPRQEKCALTFQLNVADPASIPIAAEGCALADRCLVRLSHQRIRLKSEPLVEQCRIPETPPPLWVATRPRKTEVSRRRFISVDR
jgi:hypothetical protein